MHIGKESNNLDESEVLGVDSDSYQTYEDNENLDSKFRKIAKDVLKLNPRNVKDLGISRQTFWSMRNKIKIGQLDNISNRLKIKLI